MIELRIDPEFRDKIPRPTDEEVVQLEKNMLQFGRLTDPIFVWHGYIVDGHTRYGIMQKHPDIDFQPHIEELDEMFHEKDEVIVWMCERQMGRRNITSQTRKMLADIAYEAICRLRGTNRFTAAVEDPARSSTTPAEKIAERFDMSVPHVKHAVRFGRGVRAIEQQSPGATEELMAGRSNVADATIERFPSLPDEEQKEVISALKENRKYKPNPSMESMNATPLVHESEYNTEDFKEQVGAFPKEVDDMIRLYLLVHGDMVSIPECKAAFRKALLDIKKVADKYFTEVTNAK